MHRRLALLVIVFACRKEASAPPAPEVRLFTEDEIAAYEQALMARLAETAKRTCPRPVVREPGVDGPAAPDLRALVEPPAPVATCLEGFRELANGPDLTTAKVVEERGPKVLVLEATCGEAIEQTVRKAASRRDGCSPYQVGVRADPESWMNVLSSAHLLGLRARLNAERGTPAYALAMLLDGASAYRDLGRGRVGLIGPMIAVATTDILLEQARAIATTQKLTPANLDPLIASVDALLASEPPFGETLLGEGDYFELCLGMPHLKDKAWKPPGGCPDGMNADSVTSGTKPMTRSPRDDGAIMLAAGEKMSADRSRACPTTATLKACHEGLVMLGDAANKTSAKEVGEQLWTELVKTVGSADAVATAHRIRETIIGTLVAVAHPAFAKYGVKRADGYSRLAAFRIHLEVLRAGHCPTEAELAAPPYPALRAPSALGDSLGISRATSGDLEVTVPAWIESKKPPWRISCQSRP